MVKKEVVKKSVAVQENSLGVAGVVFGILSVLSLSVGGIIMGIVGLVFSLKQSKLNKNKWSKAGIVLNIVGIILGIIAIYVLVNYAADILGQLQGLQGA
ncbi:MAG: hypothetical protein IIA87_03860 [Nanoarchaeota archaeon]|nr:hypothetical protein [Nanoarchaeota archaeon]